MSPPNLARSALLAFAVTAPSCAAPSAEDAPAAPRLWGRGHPARRPPRRPVRRHAHPHDVLARRLHGHRAHHPPNDAYRFAQGEAIPHPSGESIRLSGCAARFPRGDRPCGVPGRAGGVDRPLESHLWTSPDRGSVRRPGRRQTGHGPGRAGPVAGNWPARGDSINGPEVRGSAWQRIIEAAERHNDPGRFTALIGYEYTMGVSSRHLHRNVIFRGSEAPALPFSSLDGDPEDPLDLARRSARGGGSRRWPCRTT